MKKEELNIFGVPTNIDLTTPHIGDRVAISHRHNYTIGTLSDITPRYYKVTLEDKSIETFFKSSLTSTTADSIRMEFVIK